MIFPVPPCLLLVDVSNLAHRFWHTTGRFAAWHAREAVEVALDALAPEYAAQCCDLHAPTFRHKLSRGYKANRPPPDPECHEQVRILTELLEDTLGLRPVSSIGYEADDVIATLDAMAERSGVSTIIFGKDKDLCQLVSGRCVLWNGKGDERCEVTNIAAVVDKFGVPPRSMRDWQALVGDSTDNVFGVHGVGPKKAAAVLGAFGSLERALTASVSEWHKNDLPDSLREVIVNSPTVIELAMQLVTLRRDAPLTFDSLERLRWTP